MKPLARDIIADLVAELYDAKVLSNLIRPLYVERLLGRLLIGDWRCVGHDWSGWDLENAVTGLRVEIKQSAARQTWTDGPGRIGKQTKPIFDIEERTGHYANGGSQWVQSPGRPADLYIFAWHPKFEPLDEVDHRDPEQWVFHLLPERRLPKRQKTIGLSSLQKLHPVVALHDDVGAKVEELSATLTPLKASISAVI